MEAIAALSLASNVIQVVDFSARFTQKCISVYKSKSGLDSELQHLEDVASQLEQANATLKESLNVQTLPSASIQGDAELRLIAEKCYQESSLVIAKLHELKSNHGRSWRKAFVQTLKSYLARDDIEAMASRMAQYRATLETQILVLLRSRIESAFPEQLKEIVELQTRTGDLKAIVEENRDILANQRQMFNQLQTSNEQILLEQRGMSSQINQLSYQLQTLGSSSGMSGIDLSSSIVRTKLRNSLWHDDLAKRQMEILDAHKQTFEWIFDTNATSPASWDQFLPWLEGTQDGNVYWIRGKAGSGKSTLMNYLFSDPRTEAALTTWSGQGKTTMIIHSFWSLGSDLQNSIIGLLRSLIYQVLEKIPDLTPTVFTSEAENLRILDIASFDQSSKLWTQKELLKMFESILRLNTDIQGPICIFLDGLDECSVNTHHLMGFLQPLYLFENVKFCLSSRPLVEFITAFERRPQLKLEDLTRHDILRYTEDNLSQHALSQDYLEDNPNFVKKLSEAIVDKAQGIFLWVRIVVDSMLAGMTYRDSQESLSSSLNDLPAGLEELYKHMLKRLLSRPQQHLEVAIMFQLVFELLNLKGRLLPNPLVCLAVAQDNCLSRLKPEAPANKTLVKLVRDFELRVTYLGAGFIEVHKGVGEVHFYHKTAVDFLAEPSVWARIILPTSSREFCPWEELLDARIYLYELSKNLTSIPKRKDSFHCLCWSFRESGDNEYQKFATSVFEELNQPKLQERRIDANSQDRTQDFSRFAKRTQGLMKIELRSTAFYLALQTAYLLSPPEDETSLYQETLTLGRLGRYVHNARHFLLQNNNVELFRTVESPYITTFGAHI